MVTESEGEPEFHHKTGKSVYWEVKCDDLSLPEQGQQVAEPRQAITEKSPKTLPCYESSNTGSSFS